MEAPNNRSQYSLRSKPSSTFTGFEFSNSEHNFELSPYFGSEIRLNRDAETIELERDDEKTVVAHPTGWKLAMIMTALSLTVFCVALDNTIISTAIPSITDEFHSLDDVGWYGSVYLLTTCSLQLQFGKLYSTFSIKNVFLSALSVFEVGSLICGVAPNSETLIVGRAIAGLGSAGLFSGALITIAYTTPVEKRSLWIGIVGSVYGIASVAGPLIGGVFTDHATWRWCFYINLPMGAISAVIIFFGLRLDGPTSKEPRQLGRILKQLDLEGTAAFIPAIVCMVLALQWGGTTYAWSDGRVVALLTLFAALTVTFVGIQVWKGELATVPPRIISQRSMAFGSTFAFFLGGAFFLLVYYIPVWFQAIKNDSPIRSGVDTLPFLISEVLAMVVAGVAIPMIGYYMPFVLASGVFMSVGAGLLTTFTVDIPAHKWIGYSILYGLGAGFGFQQPTLAAQTVLSLEDTPTGTAAIMFFQLLGGAIFISAANNVFLTTLIKRLTAVAIPGLDPLAVATAGATALQNLVPMEFIATVRVAYNDALVKTFEIALILSCLSFLAALGMQWKSVKGNPNVSGGLV